MTLQKKIAIILLLFGLPPLLFIGALGYTFQEKSIQETQLAKLEVVADLKKGIIESFYKGLFVDMTVAQRDYNIRANLPVLTQNIGNYNENPLYYKAQETLHSQLKALDIKENLTDIMLVSPDGKIVYSNNTGHRDIDLGAKLPDPDEMAYSEGLKGIYFSKVFRNAVEGGRFYMLVTGPVYSLDDELIGLIAFEVDMNHVYNIIQNPKGLGSTGETLLGMKDGGKAIFLTPLRHDPEAALKREAPLGGQIAIPLQEGVLGREGSSISTDYRGNKILAAWRSIPELGWGLVAKIDTKEAFAPALRARNVIMLFITLMTMGGVILAYFVSRVMTVPIKQLQRGAELIGGGNLYHRVKVDNKDEIGELADVFNTMTKNLRRSIVTSDRLQREIRERQKVEKRLDMLSVGIEQSPISYLITDPEGTIEYANSMFTELTGYSAKEVFGKNPRMFQSGKHGADFYKDMWDTIKGGETWSGEMCNIRKDGRLFWEKTSIYPVKNDDGEIIHFIAYKEDITEKRKERQELKGYREGLEKLIGERTADLQRSNIELEEEIISHKKTAGRLADAQNMAHLGNWEWSTDRDTIDGSKEFYRIIGLPYGEEKVTLLTFLSLIDKKERSQFEDALNKAVSELSTFDTELTLILPGSKRRIISASGIAKPSGLEKAITVTGTVQDITERKKEEKEREGMQTQLLQADKMASIGQLAAGVAHEVNTPIGYVGSNVKALAKYMVEIIELLEVYRDFGVGLHEGTLTDIDEVYANTKRLEEMIDLNYILDDTESLVKESMDGIERIASIVAGLKNFSHSGTGAFEMYNINDCIKSAVKIAWHELKYKVTVVEDYGDLPLVRCRPQQLNQVFLNMIINASHAIEDTGNLTLKTYVEEESVVIEISDTGKGMDEETLLKVFDPFFTTKGVGRGSGLGLSIAYGIINDHGGTINVESTLGEGTAFRVTLPTNENTWNETEEEEIV